MPDSQTQPALVLARRRLEGRNLEKGELWYASVRNTPEDMELINAMARPFMNYAEAKSQLEKIVGEALGPQTRIKSPMAFKGQRTFFLTEAQFAPLLVPKGSQPKTKPKAPRVSLGRDYSNVQGMVK